MPPQQSYGLLDLFFERLRLGAHEFASFVEISEGGEPS
jgi:hypothetical protein